MKNLFKSLVLGVVILATSFNSAKAQTAFGYTHNTVNGVTNVSVLGGFSNGVNVSSITISIPSSSSNGTFFFYDWFATRLTNLWFTNIVTYSNMVVVDPYTNNVIFTNSLGRTNTNSYIGVYRYWTNVTANTTGSVPAIAAFTAQSGIPLTVAVNWNLAQGLAIRGTNNVDTSTFITVTYK